MSMQGLCPFFEWVGYLSITEFFIYSRTKSLSDICIENIFCQSEVWIFIFKIMSFEGKTFSILIKSNSSIFSFKDYVLGVKSKKFLPNARSGRFFSFFQKFYIRIKLEIKK